MLGLALRTGDGGLKVFCGVPTLPTCTHTCTYRLNTNCITTLTCRLQEECQYIVQLHVYITAFINGHYELMCVGYLGKIHTHYNRHLFWEVVHQLSLPVSEPVWELYCLFCCGGPGKWCGLHGDCWVALDSVETGGRGRVRRVSGKKGGREGGRGEREGEERGR